MNEAVKEKKFIKNFILAAAAILLLLLCSVLIFDPFYVYHKPLPGLKAVLNDKEYQCVGTLRHFDYDSLIVGSSVCENYNNHWFDQGFDAKTIKAIRSYGATADLCYLLDIAYENHAIKNIFYNIDPSSLSADTEPTYESTGCPTYLYDKSIWNDIPYLFNKDVITEKIPFMLASSLSGYDEGNSYNWAQWKVFSEEAARSMYNRPEKIEDMKAEDFYQEELNGNLAILTDMVQNHPETNFYFFFPPYSSLWWDNCYRIGDLDAVIYNETACIETLLSFENVKVFYYQGEEEIITNLDNYMDQIHFSKDINYQIYAKMAASEGELTKENYKQVMLDMYELALEMIEE